MEYEFSVVMGLVDFIPVILFAISMVLMQRDLYNKMPKYAFACFAAGTINILIAGFVKALWKTLYAAGICDFQVLNTLFLPTQSLGFLLAGLGIILMLTNRKKAALAVAAPPCFIVYMGMGYLGSRDNSTAAANWLEQGVNTLGQILLLIGVGGLHKAGLRDYKL